MECLLREMTRHSSRRRLMVMAQAGRMLEYSQQQQRWISTSIYWHILPPLEMVDHGNPPTRRTWRAFLFDHPQYHYFMELDLAWILVTWFSIFARANMALLVIFLIRRQTTDKFRKENSEFVCPSKSYSASVDILSVS